MFLRNEAKLCRPYRAQYILAERVPRASLRCTLGYHIVVPSGLAVRCRKLRNEPTLLDRRFQDLRSQIVPDRRSQTAATGFCETHPSRHERTLIPLKAALNANLTE